MGEIYAYARVSTEGQHVDRQIESIRKYRSDIDTEHMFIEKISGRRGMDERYEYSILRRVLRNDDELVIDSLDRLGRNKSDIKNELEYLRQKGVTLRILTIPTTLTDPEGQAWVMDMLNNLLIEVYTSIAEQEMFERERRQRDGIEAAKKRGAYKGRQPLKVDFNKFAELYIRWRAGEIKAKEFMLLMGLKPNTFYRTVERYETANGLSGA